MGLIGEIISKQNKESGCKVYEWMDGNTRNESMN